MINVKRFISSVRSHRDRNNDMAASIAMGAFVAVSLALPTICYSSLAERMNRIEERRSAEHAQAFGERYNSTNSLYSGNSITNRYVGQ